MEAFVSAPAFERDLDLAVTLAFLLLAASFGVILVVKWGLGNRMG
jgi:ABC-type sulfate transport system permease component